MLGKRARSSSHSGGCGRSGHSHPVPGIGYVLEGTIVSAFDDDAEDLILAGQGFQDKASFHRVIRNRRATELMRFLIAYTVKEGFNVAFKVEGRDAD